MQFGRSQWGTLCHNKIINESNISATFRRGRCIGTTIIADLFCCSAKIGFRLRFVTSACGVVHAIVASQVPMLPPDSFFQSDDLERLKLEELRLNGPGMWALSDQEVLIL